MNSVFDRFSLCESLTVVTILSLFKRKRAKANNKDNCRGIQGPQNVGVPQKCRFCFKLP